MPPVEWIWTYAAPGKEFRFIEQGGQVVNDDTGEIVGNTFSESMPIQMLQNGSYEVNQH